MNKIIMWLKAKFESPAGAEPDEGLTVQPENQRQDRVVSMPDIYGQNTDDTQPELPILDTRPPKPDGSLGFNPYDTATLHKK